MEVLELRIYPNSCLRVRAKSVDEFQGDLKDTLQLMADMMYATKGIGLAATQVGIGLSMFVIDAGEGLINFINPAILERSKKKSKMEEGCLSLPGVTVGVKRSEKVKVKAQNENGDFFEREFSGLTARAIQHECDHLCGRLIIDYLNPVRHFMVAANLPTLKQKRISTTCEVACSVGK